MALGHKETQGEYKANNRAIISAMGASRCRVSFTDSSGMPHSIEVQASSLYEAVVLAVVAFRQDELAPDSPEPSTEITVATIRQEGVEHKVRFGEVIKGLQPSTKGGPKGVAERTDLRKMLDASSDLRENAFESKR